MISFNYEKLNNVAEGNINKMLSILQAIDNHKVSSDVTRYLKVSKDKPKSSFILDINNLVNYKSFNKDKAIALLLMSFRNLLDYKTKGITTLETTMLKEVIISFIEEKSNIMRIKDNKIIFITEEVRSN